MSKRRFLDLVALAVASAVAIAACSSDTPTSPMTASPSLTAVAPARLEVRSLVNEPAFKGLVGAN